MKLFRSIIFSLLFIYVQAVCIANEKHIVVVILSHNNAEWYQRNLDSVCHQNYSNYHIIYIDDASTDGTADLVAAYIATHHLQDRVLLLRNGTNHGALANHYKAAWMCADEDILVHLDGDDWLKNEYSVLQRVNCAYQDPYVWLTFGQFERFPSGVKGYCRSIPLGIVYHNAYRECDWFTSHLRTCYAGLFKQIALKDFIYRGRFFPVTCDMAMLFPLLELASDHARCIDDVLYVYNEQTAQNDYKTKLLEQLHCDRVIRSRSKYTVSKDYRRPVESRFVRIIVFFTGLNSCTKLLQGLLQEKAINEIIVLYAQKDQALAKNCASLYSNVTYINYTDNLTAVLNAIAQKEGYVCFCQDDYCLTGKLPIEEAVKALEQTKALSFHFDVGNNVSYLKHAATPSLIVVTDTVYAWQYKDAEFAWKWAYAPMCLYRSSDLKRALERVMVDDYEMFIYIMQGRRVDIEQLGLCYVSSSVCKQ